MSTLISIRRLTISLFVLSLTTIPVLSQSRTGPPPPPPPPPKRSVKDWKATNSLDQFTNIQGAEMLYPASIEVKFGTDLEFAVSEALDEDYWTTSTDSGTHSNQTTYNWSASGGEFEGDTNDRYIIWRAPRTRGLYTITCLVDDDSTQMAYNDTGSRDDLPILRTFNVTVDGDAQRWAPALSNESGTSIFGGQRLTPEIEGESVKVELGQIQDFAVDDAFDYDLWQDKNGSGEESDKVSYTWTCTAGKFISNLASGEAYEFSTTVSGRVAYWVAPEEMTEDGKSNVICTIDDQPPSIIAPDTGSRDDAPIETSIEVELINPQTECTTAECERSITPGIVVRDSF
jgi:hypothetical protein